MLHCNQSIDVKHPSARSKKILYGVINSTEILLDEIKSIDSEKHELILVHDAVVTRKSSYNYIKRECIRAIKDYITLFNLVIAKNES